MGQGSDLEKRGLLGVSRAWTRKRIVMKSSNKRDDYDVTLTSGALIIPDLSMLRVSSRLNSE